jgi:hypothetical protein
VLGHLVAAASFSSSWLSGGYGVYNKCTSALLLASSSSRFVYCFEIYHHENNKKTNLDEVGCQRFFLC